MGATEEQMNLVASSGIDHVAYILILYSLAFLMFLFVNMIIGVYDRAANADLLAAKYKAAVGAPSLPGLNGHAAGAAPRSTETSQLRDAEEFELDGLMSEDEDEEHAARRKLLSREDGDEETGLVSPSTVGRNSDRIAS